MWYGRCGTLNAQYHLNFIDANMYAKVGSQSLTSIALLCHDQRPPSTIHQNRPQMIMFLIYYLSATEQRDEQWNIGQQAHFIAD